MAVKTLAFFLFFRQHYIAVALSKLPNELSSDDDCIDAVVNNTHPEQAAIMLHYFHEDKLLDNKEDKRTCLNCVQQNDDASPTQKDAFYNSLQHNWMRIKQIDQQENTGFSTDDKKDLVKHSHHLFNLQTITLWSAVPDGVLYKLYKRAMTICRQTCHHKQYLEHTQNIIDLLLKQNAVFNNARVQLDPQYDTYTASPLREKGADRTNGLTSNQINMRQL